MTCITFKDIKREMYRCTEISATLNPNTEEPAFHFPDQRLEHLKETFKSKEEPMIKVIVHTYYIVILRTLFL